MPTLDLSAVRTAIKTTIEGVAGMGMVHDYERYSKEQGAMKALYQSAAQSGNRIYGWFVSLLSVSERFMALGRYHAIANWKLVGYMSLDDADASEKLMAAQVDLVRDAFRASDDLGSPGGLTVTCIVEDQGNVAGVQLNDLMPVVFAGVLSHRARCSLATLIYF